MPSVETNIEIWNESYDWSNHGDEWSAAWGGPEAQWWGCLLPRIHRYIPAPCILEIAPGFGRWTNYLKGQCQRLTAVDLSAECIAACKNRFSAENHIEYHVNDGKSLDMVADGSVDFVFSFDSLVHAESDVIQQYIAQLAKKLTRHGVGFLHHSNLGAVQFPQSPLSRLPKGKRTLGRLGLLPQEPPTHVRARSMTAELFKTYCQQAGLVCFNQELINWGGDYLIDCLSTFALPGSKHMHAYVSLENSNFMQEAEFLSKLAPLYCK